MSFIGELKRRNVLRVGAAYVVVAWLVIQVVETIFPAFGFSDAAIRIATIVFAIGLIPTLIFAWAFELTPEGLKKESEVDRSSSITPHTGKKLDRMIMVVLALALGYFAFDKFVLSESREATRLEEARQEGRTEALVESYGDKSIAVLAFDDMSPDGDQEYLSDGIAEELLNLLAKIPELRVISRSSAFSYKGKDLKLNQVAEELNVAHILEGSVRKAGDRIRITTQLIEARSDTHLWSETYDRTLDDVFAIQDEIAATVVDQLKIKLLGDVPNVTETDPEAFALYLQARHLGRQYTPESLQQSNSLYERALAIDPDYAAAWEGLGTNYINQAFVELLPFDEGFTKAREAAEKALSIDPTYAKAHDALGWIAMVFHGDLAQAAQHYQRALQLGPNNIDIIGNTSQLLMLLGRLDEGIATNEYVAARNPVSPSSHFNLANGYLTASRWDEAIASYETALRLSPDMIRVHGQIGLALLFKGKPEAALEAFGLEQYDDYRLFGQTLALYALKRQGEHEQKLQELIERVGNEWPSVVAGVYAYRGEADRAFDWLYKSVQEEEGAFDPNDLILKSLESDPRWLPLLESIGNSPEQLAAIEFEVKIPN